MQARKDKLVSDLTSGISALFKSNQITFISGHGCLVEPGSVRVSSDHQPEQFLRAKQVILASGSQPVQLPGMSVDETTIFDSSGALAFSTVPKDSALLAPALSVLNWAVCGGVLVLKSLSLRRWILYLAMPIA